MVGGGQEPFENGQFFLYGKAGGGLVSFVTNLVLVHIDDVL